MKSREIEPGLSVVQGESRIQATAIGCRYAAGTRLSGVNAVQGRLPFRRVPGQQVRQCNLARAFEPGFISTGVPAVLFEAEAERGLVVGFDIVEGPYVALGF
jgi:hypothetical protein